MDDLRLIMQQAALGYTHLHAKFLHTLQLSTRLASGFQIHSWRAVVELPLGRIPDVVCLLSPQGTLSNTL
jgi:hypothetical protein